MKLVDFMNTARKIADETPTKYKGGGVGQHEGKYFLFDCGGLIKSILWGFCFDYSQYRGGAIYQSNGVPDVDCDTFFSKYCYNKSTDFSKIEEGELVYMEGHIGIYAGNRKVIESTLAWDKKVLVSDLGYNGARTKNGKQIYRWTHHGKCQFIDYAKPTPVEDTYYKVNTPNGLWLLDDNGKKIRVYSDGTIVKYLSDGYTKYGHHYYHVEVDSDKAIGYMAEDFLVPTEKPTPEPTPVEDLKVGDKVRIISTGNSQANGKGKKAGGIGYERKIKKIYEGQPYPYQVGNNWGTTGFYTRDALEKI